MNATTRAELAQEFDQLASPKRRRRTRKVLRKLGMDLTILLKDDHTIASLINASLQTDPCQPIQEQRAWLHWFAINRAIRQTSDTHAVGLLQAAIRSDLENNLAETADSTAIALSAGLALLLASICEQFGVVSRALLGTIILLSRSARHIVAIVDSMRDCRWGPADMLAVGTAAENAYPNEIVGDHPEPFYQEISDPAREPLDPVAALLFAVEYRPYLSDTLWYSGKYEYRSYQAPTIRWLENIGERLDLDARRRIWTELHPSLRSTMP